MMRFFQGLQGIKPPDLPTEILAELNVVIAALLASSLTDLATPESKIGIPLSGSPSANFSS
ncbi:hypothetical protein [Leptodesmis sichuanensis]|uniref:hypothetical protein n=1 Tax=Leptodesmis sichuanensis TaxID=2906798 RepID=UPI001F3A5A34|nr:hypothetical protein [Leptodesmis sichuanensis]UIE39067.1 hypothetical protein KIK02_05590 [Leptodesmis sichuanensis A121]